MKQILRYLVKLLEQQAARRGYRWRWDPPLIVQFPRFELEFSVEFVVAHLMLEIRSPYVVQIGANDGVSHDPLHRIIDQFDLEGILLEPVPEAFELLERTYSNRPKLKLLNAALSEEDGIRTIYTVRIDDGTFEKAHQFSSFSREHVLRQSEWVPDISERVIEKPVRSISFTTLLRETNGRGIDILQIDAEGYDLAIVKMIDFTRVQPRVIFFEHIHLTKGEQQEAAELLVKHGYKVVRQRMDTVAYRSMQSIGA